MKFQLSQLKTELNLCKASTQTDLCAQSIAELEEYHTLTKIINEHEFSEVSKGDDVKVKFYTGLPFCLWCLNLFHRASTCTIAQHYPISSSYLWL